MDTGELPEETQNPIEQNRLLHLLESNIKHAYKTDVAAAQANLDIARERTQFFEKIALGCGGTIALVVSFVASHAGCLHPAWLLHSALIVLVLAMFASMFRNWKYPFYLRAAHARSTTAARLDKERSRKNYIVAVPAIDVDTGEPINVQAYLRKFENDDKLLSTKLGECQSLEESTLNFIIQIDRVALVLAAAGISLLSALALINF